MPNRDAGQILGGKYRLVNRLGTGGMGSVWRAEHLTLSSPVALKLIEPTTARESDAVHRFLREARTAAALRSPHVVQILDYGVDGDSPYIVMELLDGESLAERLERLGRLSATETARIIQHISRALGRAHEAGIVHRDLKPENVFIVENDDEEVAKVLDFGIVKTDPNTFGTANSGAATRTGTLLGTPYFMSPEQAEGAKSVDFRADIWALGVIAYRCLLGKLPFTGESVGRLILEICSRPLPVPSHRGPVPDGFDDWFARTCAREPNARFESAKRAAAELSRLTDEAAATSPVETPQPPELGSLALATTTLKSSSTEVLPPPRRRPRPLALALAAVATLTLIVTISVPFLRTARSSSEAPARAQLEQTKLEERREALEASASAAGSSASSSPAAPDR
ncbi:MAG TPA: serine/threonine-protein kinase, partial [Polyangiaceae bacterium]|nr:serine/threonine-protein kinase [Polyangiaceae bacterium]